MSDRALLSMAQQFKGLPMGSLIGGPLNAAAKANSAMALTQTTFMLDTCFTRTSDGTNADTGEDLYSYSPIMIKMQLTRGVLTPTEASGDEPASTTIQNFTTTFNLPLLTIIPLNSLAVETVDIGFEMEVKSSFSEDTEEKREVAQSAKIGFEAKVGWGPFSATVTGSASYDSKDSASHSTHYQKSNSAKYTVNVHAGQLPLPQGVTTIIEAFSKAIEPIQMPAQAGSDS